MSDDIDDADAWPSPGETVDGQKAAGKPQLNSETDSFVATDGSDAPVRQIGPYKLLRLLGEGGMGHWLAEQSQPVVRRVALKIIKDGYKSRDIPARFEAERQALAMMNHPNIARIFDGGVATNGQPYFVMEWVQGIPLTSYCDKHKLSIDDRLELFVQVCHAVQHAHQKGILHRDLKPSNILVAHQDGRPLPKIIDFGLAKAIDSHTKLTDKSLFTEFGTVVGTLQYMSPEQAELNSLDIDTRTDIYALGVLLYELLTGSTPIERESLERQALLTVLANIRQLEPPRPSDRLHSSVHNQSSISATRRIDPSRLQKVLRGDLDWIVMKAIEKDRLRRYDSADGFASDIRRYLSDQTVSARPPSASYRISKFVKKNRTLVASAVCVLLAILMGTAVAVAGWRESTIQARLALKARDEATASAEAAERARNAESEQRRLAESNLARATAAEQEILERVEELEEITAFQESQLSGIDMAGMAEKAKVSLLTMLKSSESASRDLEEKLNAINFVDFTQELIQTNILERAQETINTQFVDRPLFRATMLQSLGRTMNRLGLLNEALSVLEASRELRLEHQGSQHTDTLSASNNLAKLYDNLGRYAEAEVLYRAVLAARTEQLGVQHELTRTAAGNLAACLLAQAKFDEAEKLLLDTLEMARIATNGDETKYMTLLHNLASFYSEKKQYSEAESYYRRSLDASIKALGEGHIDTLKTMINHALVVSNTGNQDEAERLLRQTVTRAENSLGNRNYLTLTAMNNLAGHLGDMGKSSEALNMPPEQVYGSSEEITPGADIYSLGAILYECLTGSPPFRGATLGDTLEQVRCREPVRIRQLVNNVPIDLETIAFKCLNKQPEQRYPTADALKRDLERFLAGRPIEARRPGWLKASLKWCNRNRSVAALLATIAALISVSLVGLSSVLVRLKNEYDDKLVALAERTAALAEKADALAKLDVANDELRLGQMLAEQRLYNSQITLAQRALDAKEFARCEDLLRSVVPASGQADQRGFEWKWLTKNLHRDLIAEVTAGDQEVIALAYVGNGQHIVAVGGD